MLYDRDKSTVYIKTDNLYKDIAEYVETSFDTSNYELEKPLPKGKNKKVIGLMKYDLGGKIMTKFFRLRAKTFSYLIDDGSEDNKAKRTKMCVTKRKLKFENYKNCLEAAQLEKIIKHNYLANNEIDMNSIKKNHKEFIRNNKSILKIHQRFKSESHNVFTEEINKKQNINFSLTKEKAQA